MRYSKWTNFYMFNALVSWTSKVVESVSSYKRSSILTPHVASCFDLFFQKIIVQITCICELKIIAKILLDTISTSFYM